MSAVLYVWNWLAAVDWRIVGLAAAWLAYVRRGDLAALAAKLWPGRGDLTTKDTKGTEEAEVVKAEIADPVDRAMLTLRKHRDELGQELERLEARLKDVEDELVRIDRIFPDDETTIPERTY